MLGFLGSPLSPKALCSMESAPQTPKGNGFLSVLGWVCAGSVAVWCGCDCGIMSIWKLGTVVFASGGPGRRSGQRFKVSMACVSVTRARVEGSTSKLKWQR